jgi:hypothetical protein
LSDKRDNLLEHLSGRSLSDIRIHDSAQAGRLAERLGARAFTVGRDIYVRPELADASTPEGRGLLAHEITHAVEQTGGSIDMPLLRPSSTSAASAVQAAGNVTIQRMDQATAASQGSPASLPSSETRAERAEASSGSTGGAGGPSARSERSENAPQAPDAEELAEKVYRLMVEELWLDRERGA